MALVEEADLKGAQSLSSPRVHWQPLPWWDVGLELEGLKPEPDACQGFSELNGYHGPIGDGIESKG